MIGRVLEIAEPTVKNHVTAVMKALKASNRTETVIAATALDWGTRKRRGIDCPTHTRKCDCPKKSCSVDRWVSTIGLNIDLSRMGETGL